MAPSSYFAFCFMIGYNSWILPDKTIPPTVQSENKALLNDTDISFALANLLTGFSYITASVV